VGLLSRRQRPRNVLAAVTDGFRSDATNAKRRPASRSSTAERCERFERNSIHGRSSRYARLPGKVGIKDFGRQIFDELGSNKESKAGESSSQDRRPAHF
jgi:hypothetical protein